jgi:hypothetical protein
MDAGGNNVVQVVAVRYDQPYQYFVVPYGLNIGDKEQVSDYWIHHEILRIRLAKDFVQQCPQYGCDVIHGEGQVLTVDAFESIDCSNPTLTNVPKDIDFVENTVEHLMRLHNRCNVEPAEPYVPVPNDFPYWNKIAADIFDVIEGVVYSWHLPNIVTPWSSNVGDVIFKCLGLKDH